MVTPKPSYRNLFENLNRPMYFTSVSGKFLEVNDAFVELFGYSREELKKLSVYELYVDKDSRRKLMEKIEETKYIKEEYFELKNKDNQIMTCENTAVVVYNENGEIMGYQGMIEDRTKELSVQKRLKLLKRAVRQSVNIVIITDSDGHIEFVNPQFTKTTGYTEKEVIGKTPRILKSGRGDQSIYRQLWDTISSGNVWKGKFNNMTKNGQYYWARSTISPIFNEKGTMITHYIDVQEDITKEIEYKEKLEKIREKNFDLQQQLIQNEKLQAIGQLAGGVAHDFNNLLTIIINNLELLKLSTEDNGVLDIAENITKASNRATNLIQRLLNYSRKTTYDFEILDVHSLLDNIKAMLNKMFYENFHIYISKNADVATVEADQSAIENVFINMIVNATEAMPEGGTVSVITETEYVDPESPLLLQNLSEGEYLKILIVDNGMGMDDKTLNKIFEPFFTTKENGVGLGLASSYGTIASHNGMIRVESNIESGSTFYIYLPLFRDVEKSNKEVLNQSMEQHQKNIMVVDDEELIVESLEKILSEHGHTTHSYTNPIRAIQFYHENWKDIDIVILDLKMPGMTGYEVLQKLKHFNPDIRVIIYSGNMSENESIMYDQSVIAVIHKPFNKNDLLSIINRYPVKNIK